jgi:hypothetical protein
VVRFSYTVYHPITGVYLGQLHPKSPTWVETVNGSGSFTCRVVVPADEVVREGIRITTEPDNSLQVQADNGLIPWFGYILKRKWIPGSNELEVTAVEWRSYLNRILLAPYNDTSTSNTVQYLDTDQLEIARQVISREVTNGSGKGIPYIDTVSTVTSGILRDVLVDGRKFASVGSVIDSLANAERGFEWDILPVVNSDGTYSKRFETYFPERGSVIETLEFSYGPRGNIIDYDEPEESHEDLVRRQWAIGEGPSSDVQPYAYDDDPNLANLLRFDKATQWQDATDLIDLASKARSERTFYGVPLQLFSFTTLMSTPHAYTYAKGDRCRLIVKDRWLDLSYDNVRIVERTLHPDTQEIKITLDLSDLEVTEVDEDGVV